jgi:hypothetical protein
MNNEIHKHEYATLLHKAVEIWKKAKWGSDMSLSV